MGRDAFGGLSRGSEGTGGFCAAEYLERKESKEAAAKEALGVAGAGKANCQDAAAAAAAGSKGVVRANKMRKGNGSLLPHCFSLSEWTARRLRFMWRTKLGS